MTPRNHHKKGPDGKPDYSGEKAYNKKKSAYRTELSKLRRQKGLKKGDGKEVHHTPDGKTTVMSRKKNRTMANKSAKRKRSQDK